MKKSLLLLAALTSLLLGGAACSQKEQVKDPKEQEQTPNELAAENPYILRCSATLPDNTQEMRMGAEFNTATQKIDYKLQEGDRLFFYTLKDGENTLWLRGDHKITAAELTPGGGVNFTVDFNNLVDAPQTPADLLPCDLYITLSPLKYAEGIGTGLWAEPYPVLLPDLAAVNRGLPRYARIRLEQAADFDLNHTLSFPNPLCTFLTDLTLVNVPTDWLTTSGSVKSELEIAQLMMFSAVPAWNSIYTDLLVLSIQNSESTSLYPIIGKDRISQTPSVLASYQEAYNQVLGELGNPFDIESFINSYSLNPNQAYTWAVYIKPELFDIAVSKIGLGSESAEMVWSGWKKLKTPITPQAGKYYYLPPAQLDFSTITDVSKLGSEEFPALRW